MKVLVITGSAHGKGTSALMADEFIRGAKDAGHEVERFDAGKAKVHGCTGCNHCEYGKNPCIFRDDMEGLNPKMLEADAIVLVSPVYYWGLSSQLKAVIDRWQPTVFAMQHNKKSVLLTTQASNEDWVTEPVDAWYKNLLRFMEWENAGRLAAKGVMTRANIEATDYPQQAYVLGKQLD